MGLTHEYLNWRSGMTSYPKCYGKFVKFEATLTPRQKEAIHQFHRNPDTIIPPIYRLSEKQMSLYKRFYNSLPDGYKKEANELFGPPLDAHEVRQGLVNVIDALELNRRTVRDSELKYILNFPKDLLDFLRVAVKYLKLVENKDHPKKRNMKRRGKKKR